MAGITWHYVFKFIITGTLIKRFYRNDNNTLKILGDAAVGKSSLLIQLTDQRFLANPDPTVRFISFLERPSVSCWNVNPPVLLPFFFPSYLDTGFYQLGVEFGSKLITLPDDNKVVKLQCEFWSFGFFCCVTVSKQELIRLGYCRPRVISLYNTFILSRGCGLSPGLRCDVSEKSVYF